MRDYATVAPQFWLGKTGRELRKKGAEAQVVSFYLMTSPHANMLGLYYLPILYIAHETGLGLEGASKGLNSCLLYTSPSPRDVEEARMPSSA